MSRSYYLWSLIGVVFVGAFWSTYVAVAIIGGTATQAFTSSSYISIPVPRTSKDITSSSSSILFTGDILLSRKVERYMRTEGIDYPFRGTRSLFSNKTAVVINFEAAIPFVHKPTPDFITQFSVATSVLPILSEIGITHASLANNHSVDFGRTGYDNTWRTLQDVAVIPFGDSDNISSSSITVIELGRYKIGLLGVHSVFAMPNQSDLVLQLAELTKISDVQIAYVHWGIEYQLHHSLAQENLARILIAAGIDSIIGHHPHVTQDIQLINGVPVFYSLGNFIFDQYFSNAVRESYVLDFSISEQSLVYNLLPVSSLNKQSQPTLMSEGAKQNFLDRVAARSQRDIAQNIKQGKLIIPFYLASSSKSRIISQ